jgi:hypothetical protein
MEGSKRDGEGKGGNGVVRREGGGRERREGVRMRD